MFYRHLSGDIADTDEEGDGNGDGDGDGNGDGDGEAFVDSAITHLTVDTPNF